MILDGNVMNMSLIIMEGKYGAIDADDPPCHGYYIINFPFSKYPSYILEYLWSSYFFC